MKKTGKSKVTMGDIAGAENVSHTTVSFVLRGREMGIKAATRDQVLSRAISLGYRTRPDQRILLQKESLLLLVPEYRDIYGKDSYAGKLFSHMASMEKESGFQIVIHSSMERDILRSLYKGVCEDGVSAVITLNLGYDEQEKVVRLSPVPVICLSQWVGDLCSWIAFDDCWIGAEAARQFNLAGHRKAAIFTSTKFTDQRSKGFKDEWRKLGGKITNITLDSYLTSENVAERFKSLLQAGHDFTALFCSNDNLCLWAMRVIYQRGLSVPGDISLIGCDNHGFTRFLHPPLSTFSMDAATHAKQLLDGARRLVRNPGDKLFISNKADFISRESVRKIFPLINPEG